MLDLTKPWPLGLTRKNWPDYLKILLLTLFILLFFDAWASRSLIVAPDIWRQPFFFITHFGLSDWVLIPALVVFLLSAVAWRLMSRGAFRLALYEASLLAGFVFLAVGGAGLATNLLKRLIGRGRPTVFDDAGAFDFHHVVNDWTYQSFPSGHSTTAIATALVIGFIAPRYFGLLLTIALMTGVSRVIVGDHYPTDVLAGFAMGTIVAYAIRNFFASRRWLFARTPDGHVRFRGLPALRTLLARRQRAAE